MKSFSNKKGTSIVIALGLIAAISAFTIGIASTMLIAIQNTSSSKKALQAEYSAQGGEEIARKELKAMGVAYGGAAKSGTICVKGACPNGVPDPNTSTYFSYEVKGLDTAPLIGGYRFVPVAGTGSAGNDCKIGVSGAGKDDPCNWNKLYYGDSVEMPLYVMTQLNPETVKNFGGLGGLNISSFQIKVRTPCESGIPSASCSSRYSVDVAGLNPGNVVVNWQISGMCVDESCGVGATNAGGDSFINELALSGGFASIDFFQKNGADVNDPSKTGCISSFLKNLDPWVGNNLNKPVLKLSFVNEITDSNKNIPYLEYQILYRGGPLAASYTVTIDGKAEGFLYSLSGVQSAGAGLFDFAVQN